MRAFLIFLLFILYTIGARWYYVCQVRGLCEDEVGRPTTLALIDEEGRTILKGYEEFYFEPSNISPIMSDDNAAFLDAVAEYLADSEDQNLTITGFYRPSEQEVTSGYFENIGIARADRIRSLLVRRGIDEDRITLDYSEADRETLNEPVDFGSFNAAQPSEFEKTAFTFTNMTYSDANFEYNSADFQPGGEFKEYADSVSTYLKLNPDKSLTIVGHTDSIGSDAYNNPLGLERAENARQYFIEVLEVENPITVQTMGKKRPVAPNSTPSGKDNPEGRQKNRRVNFIIE